MQKLATYNVRATQSAEGTTYCGHGFGILKCDDALGCVQGHAIARVLMLLEAIYAIEVAAVCEHQRADV